MSRAIMGRCDLDLDLWPQFKNSRVRNISPTLFEAGLQNLVCGCIMVLWSVKYHFGLP